MTTFAKILVELDWKYHAGRISISYTTDWDLHKGKVYKRDGHSVLWDEAYEPLPFRRFITEERENRDEGMIQLPARDASTSAIQAS